jgi:hypothetical protein
MIAAPFYFMTVRSTAASLPPLPRSDQRTLGERAESRHANSGLSAQQILRR